MSCPKENNKADKSNKDLTDILGLTARDIEVLVKAYSCMKETVQVSMALECLFHRGIIDSLPR